MLLPQKFYSDCLLIVISWSLVFGYEFNDEAPQAKLETNDDESSAAVFDENGNGTDKTFKGRKWISQLFNEGQRNFNMGTDVSDDCRKDFDLFKLHLQNSSVWAVRMLESSEWPFVGIYSGMNYHLGNWRECLLISKYNVTGQYCLVNTVYDIIRRQITENSQNRFNETTSAWHDIEMYQKQAWRVDRKNLNWALCIPASCKHADVVNSLNRTLHPIFTEQDLSITVTVDPLLCTVKKTPNLPFGFYLVWGFIAALFVMLVVSTFFDGRAALKKSDSDSGVAALQKNVSSSGISQLFAAFSVVRNYKKLVKVSPIVHGGGVNVMKFFYMCSVLYGHRSIYFLGYPRFNPEYIESTLYSKYETGFALRALLLVDAFFTISGFLTFHLGFSQIRKNGLNSVLRTIFLRWIRMVPVFLLVALIVIYILPYISEGPFWDSRISVEVGNCKTTFWTNVFAVSNIVNPEKMCLYTSWYVSVDIQLTIIGCALMLLIAKNERLGIIFTILLFAGATVATFVVAYVNKYHALLPSYMNFLEDPRKYKDFTRFYITTYAKCTSYLIGFAAAIVAKKLREKKFAFSQMHIHWMTIFLIVVKISVLLYTPQLYEFNKEYNQLENALSGALLRSTFVLPDSILLCAYFTSGWGKFGKVFDLDIFIPIGRLLYCVFLVHILIQIFHAASHQVLMPSFSLMPKFWIFVGDVVFSIFAAALLHFLVEAPLNTLSTIIVNRLLATKKKSESSLPDPNGGHLNKTFSQGDDKVKSFGSDDNSKS